MTINKEPLPSHVPTWIKLYDLIARNPGITRTMLQRSISSTRRHKLNASLQEIVNRNLAHPRNVGDGRHLSQAWYVGKLSKQKANV